MVTMGHAQIGGSSWRLQFYLTPVAGARETCSMQIDSAVYVPQGLKC